MLTPYQIVTKIIHGKPVKVKVYSSSDKQTDKLLKAIMSVIPSEDQSCGFVNSMFKERCLGKSLRPNQERALWSIYERLVTGVDGGYRPLGSIDSANVQLNDDSHRTKEWADTRGFLTQKQFDALKEKGKL